MLITGGTGTIGRALARELLAHHPRVCIYSRGEYAQSEMARDFDSSALRFFIGDVRDRRRLTWAMRGVTTVYHCAALKRIEVGHYNPIEMVRTNVDGSVNVIEAALEAGVREVVQVSTDKAWEPISPYGYSKALADSIFLSANNIGSADAPKFYVVRLGNVAGSTGSVIPTWRGMIASGRTQVPITDPDCTRFWMTPVEAARAVIEKQSPLSLRAYKLGDLAQAMKVKTCKIGLNDYEKYHETLWPGVTSADTPKMTVAEIEEALCRL